MEVTTIYLSILAGLATAVIYLYIGSQDAKNMKSASDYLLYRRQLVSGQVFGTVYASGMSLATVFIAYLQLAPYLGTKLIWSVIFYSLGYVVLWGLISKILSNCSSGVTLHGFLFNKYNSATLRYVASISTTIGFLGVFATELIVGSHIFGALFKTDSGYWLSLALVSAVVVGYSLLGGFKSVVRTDKIQSVGIIFVSILLVVIAFSIGRDKEGILIPQDLTSSWFLPPLLMVNFFLINVLFPLVDMSAWQRVIAAKDEATAKSGIFTSIIFFLLSWAGILFAALALSENHQSDLTGGLILNFLQFGSLSWINSLLSAIAFAALIAAMVSTADTFLIAAGQTISMDIRDHDFFKNSDISKNESNLTEVFMPDEDHKVINRTRLNMLFLSVVGLGFCVWLTVIGFKVAELVFAVYGSTLSLVPVVVLALFLNSEKTLNNISKFAVSSIIVGVFCGWGYGILSVIPIPEGSLFYIIAHSLDKFIGAPSAYNSPSVAFCAATFVLLAGYMINLIFGAGGPKNA